MRLTLRLFVVAALGIVGLAISTSTSAETSAGSVTPGVSFAATDQVIVKMQPGHGASVAALGRASGQSVTKVRNLTADTVVVRLPGAQSDAALRGTVNAMARVQGVEWVEPDVRMTTQTNDPLFAQQWDLGPAGTSAYGIDLASAWSALPTGPETVNVAVVDTGYVDHADLAGVFLPGYDFVDDARIANDGDGRDADASDPGDWITSQESRRGFFRGCQSGNSSWHGTHVAGTIAAVADNGTGIAGINPHASIVPVRVLGKCGGYTSDITDGVRWAAGLSVGVPVNQNVAKVINLSLGGSGACSSTWQSAIDAVTAAGTTVVVAAGNSNADASGYSPASCNGVVTVASTGKAGKRAYYSNYGSTVELAAPGGDKNADAGDTILSTLNTGTTSPIASPAGDTYVKYQGTSMASPHVAGVVSLMLSAKPGLTPGQIGQLLQQTVTPFPSGSTCSTSTCGAGILNAAKAVTAAAGSQPPSTTQPSSTTLPPPAAVPGTFGKIGPASGSGNFKKGVTLSWEASAGATGYSVCIEVDSSPDGVCNSFTKGPYSGTSIRFVGLASGSTFEWQVRADNASGSTVASGAAWSFSTR